MWEFVWALILAHKFISAFGVVAGLIIGSRILRAIFPEEERCDWCGGTRDEPARNYKTRFEPCIDPFHHK